MSRLRLETHKEHPTIIPKEDMDELCEFMSEDPDDPFTYKYRHKEAYPASPNMTSLCK